MFKYRFSLALLFALNSLAGQAAVTLNVDRLVYKDNGSDAALTVKSDESRTYLIQSWIDDGSDAATSKAPFVVTPPLFKLKAKSENVIRVMYLGSGLPTDRESLFWLNVKAIPGLSGDEVNIDNSMIIAMNNKIKLFYRPVGLKGDSKTAIKDIHWVLNGGQVNASNQSPYYVVLSNIEVNNEKVKVSVDDNNTVIAPYSQKTFQFKKAVTAGTLVKWQGINDFGDTSEDYSQRID